jgi:hypothetical protein
MLVDAWGPGNSRANSGEDARGSAAGEMVSGIVMGGKLPDRFFALSVEVFKTLRASTPQNSLPTDFKTW